MYIIIMIFDIVVCIFLQSNIDAFVLYSSNDLIS